MKKMLILISIFLIVIYGYFIFFEQEKMVNYSVHKNIISLSEVVSMGRDDDDGKAKKWHIGGLD